MKIDNILKKYPDENDENVETYTSNCYCSVVFDDNQILNFKLRRIISLVYPTFIRQKLFKKIYSLEKNEDGYKYSFISELRIEFISCLSSMTFKNYLQQPKQKIEWSFIRKTESNPKFVNVDMNIYNPSMDEIRTRIIWLPEEGDDEYYHFFIHLFKHDNFEIFY